jgi:hypothetical protein
MIERTSLRGVQGIDHRLGDGLGDVYPHAAAVTLGISDDRRHSIVNVRQGARLLVPYPKCESLLVVFAVATLRFQRRDLAVKMAGESG